MRNKSVAGFTPLEIKGDVRSPNGGLSLTGFTLIELMIIVAILGILITIALPKFTNMIQKAKEGRTKGSLGAFRSAVNIYYADNEGYLPYCNKVEAIIPPTTGGGFIANSNWDFFVPQYINEIPGVYTGQVGVWGSDKFGGVHEGKNRVALAYRRGPSGGVGAVTDAAAGNARPDEPYEYLYYVCEDGPIYAGNMYNGHIWINCDLLDTKEEKIILW